MCLRGDGLGVAGAMPQPSVVGPMLSGPRGSDTVGDPSVYASRDLLGRPESVCVMSVGIEFHNPQQAPEGDLDEARELMSEYFEAPAADLREALSDCDELILYRERVSGSVCGITRLEVIDLEVDDTAVRALVTGSVVLADAYRGRNLIHRAGAWSFLRHGLWTRRQVYWFSNMTSYRAYLLAARNMPEVWPGRHGEMSPRKRHIYEALVEHCFSRRWDPDREVCVPGELGLKPDVLEAPPSTPETDPDLQFFFETNPGFSRGEALPVLVPLGLSGFASMGLRLLRRKVN